MSRGFPRLDSALEAKLVERGRGSAADRDEVMSELFRLFREPVLTLAFHVVGDRAEAEDVVQQVFLSVHGALPMFRGDARLSTWIYRIALRAAVAARSRRPRTEAIDDAMSGPSLEQHLDLREEARRVARAMDRLSAEHRAVLSLFAIEELSHQEIAEILGVPEGTVWSRLSIARKRLHEALASASRPSGGASR